MTKKDIVFISMASFLICCCQMALSQSAQITGTIKNVPKGKFVIVRKGYQFDNGSSYLGRKEIILNDAGDFKQTIDITEPEIMKGSVIDSNGNTVYNHNLYLSPGDNLTMLFQNNIFKVTGKGNQNNQFLDIDDNDSINTFYGDTMPGRPIEYLQTMHARHLDNLEKYIRQYHPSHSFMLAWRKQLQYEMLNNYFIFSTNNFNSIRGSLKNVKPHWDSVLSTLYLNSPLINEGALVAPNYKNFLSTYLSKSKESLWIQYQNERSSFLLMWYGIDTAAGAKLFEEDKSNDLQQRLIEKNFTGRIREYLYAVLINHSLGDRDFVNLEHVYNRFQTLYPGSQYAYLFTSRIHEMTLRKRHQITGKMKFLDAEKLRTADDVFSFFKNKTVLLDMWGTWCGPCRQDLDRHSEYLKSKFRDKGLEFAYVANWDAGHEKLWKQLIGYFNLQGYHILASKELTEDLMKKVKGQGFPTYVIIRKDGSFELYERGFGIDREKLSAQIERALNF